MVKAIQIKCHRVRLNLAVVLRLKRGNRLEPEIRGRLFCQI
jgi:hypothetical protein